MLIRELRNLMESNKYYKDLYFRAEGNTIVIGLEETFYDYDFEPVALMEILQNYCYEWYNSVEIEVYL